MTSSKTLRIKKMPYFNSEILGMISLWCFGLNYFSFKIFQAAWEVVLLVMTEHQSQVLFSASPAFTVS